MAKCSTRDQGNQKMKHREANGEGNEQQPTAAAASTMREATTAVTARAAMQPS